MYPLQLCTRTLSLPSDPTFTAENVMEMTRDVGYNLLALTIFQVPIPKKLYIDHHYQSEKQCREAAVSHFLLTHPCPSWRRLSQRLKQYSGNSAVAVAVTKKYVKGE